MAKFEVVYASETQQVVLELAMLATTETVQAVIQRSGILDKFPEIDLAINKVGIFGQLVKLDQAVNANDRIEIYRPLTIDPKTARRHRAELKKHAK